MEFFRKLLKSFIISQGVSTTIAEEVSQKSKLIRIRERGKLKIGFLIFQPDDTVDLDAYNIGDSEDLLHQLDENTNLPN